MRLQVLGSTSKGNSYLLTDSEGNTLVIELGVHFKDVQKVLKHQLTKVVGCLVTHEHGDHCKYMANAIFYGLNIYATKGTFEALDVDLSHHQINVVQYQQEYTIGPFKVIPFETQHDVKEPCGFLIYHREMGVTLFLTDTTYSKYSFDVDHILIEANYSESILEESDDEKFLKDRIIKSHMSLETCIKTLKRFDMRKVKNIVLLHLSDRNADENLFKSVMIREFGKITNVAIKNFSIGLFSRGF